MQRISPLLLSRSIDFLGFGRFGIKAGILRCLACSRLDASMKRRAAVTSLPQSTIRQQMVPHMLTQKP